VRPGDVVELVIEKGVYGGLGLARIDGRVVLVRTAHAGDRIRASVTAVRRGYAEARPLERLADAPGRRASPCRYSPPCGGCSYQDLDYAAQLALKEGILRESLARAGVRWDGPLPLHGSPESGWRTRCTFHTRIEAGGVQLGLFEEGSRRIVVLEQCLQLSGRMTRALEALRVGLAERGRWAAAVRQVRMAESSVGPGLAVCLETEAGPAAATPLAGLAEAIPELTGLGVVTADARGPRFANLFGTPRVRHRVGPLELSVHVRAFFQSNRFLIEPLVAEVARHVAPATHLLDLYAGVGLFALALGGGHPSVRAIEADRQAAEDAEMNLRGCGLPNARFIRGDVRAALEAWPVTPPEQVVLDPPRTGLGPGVVARVARRRPVGIVYVSCDPPTLGRDLQLFDREGYTLDAVAGLDMFPDTAHLEVVANLLPR